MKINKQNKILYYLAAYARQLAGKRSPDKFFHFFEEATDAELLHRAQRRIDYYNKLSGPKIIPSSGTTVADLRSPISPKTYYHDTYEYARYFPDTARIDFQFGDVIEVPGTPSIVKSRPIDGENENSVLLNLDKARHFVWVKDTLRFEDKRPKLIGRFFVTQPHRIRFFERYYTHPLCDLGQINQHGGNAAWIKPKISIAEHLKYKFILSLEGNDVATNLKWVMSSNSIAVMPRPKYETWFMEGTLLPNVHYIEIAEDFSDVEEKLTFYAAHPELCLEIIRNANAFCQQFQDKNTEKYISLKVLEKYFHYCRGL